MQNNNGQQTVHPSATYPSTTHSSRRIALILSGGGARAAYQVGVLKAVADITGSKSDNPFKIIIGTSAGAINAALLACGANDFARAISRLERLWGNLTSDQIHRTGYSALLKSTLNLIFSFFRSGDVSRHQLYLLDNSPLFRLLQESVDLTKLPERIANGDLWALGITAMEYSTGHSVNFYQGSPLIEEWQRHRRIGIKTDISYEHLMASAAIPGVYPAVKIQGAYYGDGALRDSAPTSPALRLGADKLFVIGSSHNPYDDSSKRTPVSRPPSAAQIVSHLLNFSFLDTLEEDVERLERLNEVADRLNESDRSELGIKPVQFMSVIPSVPIDELAAGHISSLPRSMRTFFKTLGVTGESGGASLASYLLFEFSFLTELMHCGYDDGLAQRDEISGFMRSH